jgi:ankyrin repeat protein
MQDKNKNEDREIHQAAKAGDLTALRKLLFADRSSIEASDRYETKPLHHAARSGSLECVKFLVENGANVNANAWFGTKPLHYAARGGNVECVRFLVENGANIHAKCSGNKTTAIFEASTVEVAQFLVERGAKLNLISSLGRVPLDYAIQQGKHIEVVRYLIRCGVDVNYQPRLDCFRTMLQWCISEVTVDESNPSNLEKIEISKRMLEILLEAGGDPSKQNAHGATVLHLAVMRKLKPIVELLLRYGADPCIRDAGGNSCFDYTDDESILELLKPYRANLVEFHKKQDDFETLIERLIATGEARRSQFRSCSEAEIANLEISHGVKLPEEYKKFLRVMGKGAGSFLTSDHWSIFMSSFDDHLGKHFFECEDDDDEEPTPQPEIFFVFASRMGDSNLGFFADGVDNDPEIYEIDYEGNIKKMYDSIWGFIQEMVEYYEFYLNPQRFTPVFTKKNWWELWK